LVKNAKAMSGINLIVEQLADEISVEDMRSIALDLRSKIKDGVVVLATVVSSKPLIVASVSPVAIKLGIKAGELIKTGSTILGGGGGGKDDFAQGGGTDSESIVKAMAEITKVISGKIK
jgi:alanyl-tRNA synthetase